MQVSNLSIKLIWQFQWFNNEFQVLFKMISYKTRELSAFYSFCFTFRLSMWSSGHKNYFHENAHWWPIRIDQNSSAGRIVILQHWQINTLFLIDYLVHRLQDIRILQGSLLQLIMICPVERQSFSILIQTIIIAIISYTTFAYAGTLDTVSSSSMLKWCVQAMHWLLSLLRLQCTFFCFGFATGSEM